MKYALPILAIVLTALSCSEPEIKDRPQVPFSGEYVPVSFILEPGGTESPVQDCINDLGEFSSELKEFVLGNFTMGDTLNSTCPGSLCGGFSGPYRWVSRCDADYSNKGTWTCHDGGATLSFTPDASPDSTLAFMALNSVKDGVWKLWYKKGDSSIELRYKLTSK